ncbi:Toll/interleukin-1 receptor domain-containing protein [Tanacetum coccineum]|uniref:Toll/interleukin-1 receptor domain-containing protein n=1 Tax=Tanacetum coccineum TaxID=301880 RepID=A0ABQ4X8Y1_9ASTR
MPRCSKRNTRVPLKLIDTANGVGINQDKDEESSMKRDEVYGNFGGKIGTNCEQMSNGGSKEQSSDDHQADKERSMDKNGEQALPFDVFLTTYDIALIDQDFLSHIPCHYAVINEAQRLKHPSSVDARITQLDNEIRNMSIDSSLVTYAINGIRSKYPDAALVIRLREKSPTFDELRSMMLLEESDMSHSSSGNFLLYNTPSSPIYLLHLLRNC